MRKLIVLFCLIALAISQSTNKTCVFPEVGTYNFTSYCGYLEITTLRRLYYVFMEANTTEPETKPLVIWFNGGPGCSSLIGLLQENGPFINKAGTNIIYDNIYSWNNVANVLYLESPAGVGFSENNDTNYQYNDNNTAADNYVALMSFYKMFPQYQSNPLWLTGESYAGQYVPFFATEILNQNQNKSNPQVNLTGIMVGNGVMNFTSWSLNSASIEYMAKHQLFGRELEQIWYNECQTDFSGPRCTYFNDQLNKITEQVNPYNIYNYNDPGSEVNTSLIYGNFHPFLQRKIQQKQQFSFQTKRFLEQVKQNNDEPQILDYMTQYYNQYKANLNVESNKTWSQCANINYNGFLPGSVLLYPNLVSSGIKILIFNGDNDSVCPINGNLNSIQWIQQNTGRGITSYWRQWVRSDNQIAGFTQQYDGWTFASVRGAGHMVPQYQPYSAFEMFSRFLNGTQL